MNWTHRRPFRNQFLCGGTMNKTTSMNHALTTTREHVHVPNQISDKPIDAIRLQLADDKYDHRPDPCPVHRREDYNPHRVHPYIRAFSDHNSSLQRTHSSVHSISTIETDFVHQRVSTIHTYPSSPSMVEQPNLIDEDSPHEPIIIDNDLPTTDPSYDDQNELNQRNDLPIAHEQKQQQQQSNECRTCSMLIDIVDQQAQQIRQYTEQISQQADLLAKLARRFAGFEENVDDQNSDKTTEQQSSRRLMKG